MLHHRSATTWISTAALLAALSVAPLQAAEPARVWGEEAYRIQVLLAIDAPGQLADQLAEELPLYLRDRANTAIGTVWRLTTEVARGATRGRLLADIDRFELDENAESDPADKTLLLVVRVTPWGFELAAREYDHYLQRWAPTIRRSTRQRDSVAEQLFELAVRAVAPLARLRPDPQDPQRVELELRGGDLPSNSPDFSWVEVGDVFQPVLRRTTRDGTLAAGGLTDVPWTYLEVVEPAKGATLPVARVRAVSQRPLGARRGRVEQLAIALRNDPGDSVLALHARIDKEKPLVGYEAFARNMDQKSLRSLGNSGNSGEVTVSPGDTNVQMVIIKSGGLTLSAIPIVPGSTPRIDVWLPDDDMRLRAAARLSALREDVVDLVARRSILIARVRQQIDEKHLDSAAKLLESLDELPGQTQFSRDLDLGAQEFRTNDVQVQRRIDRLFAETRKALGKFLDPQSIGALHDELRQAQETSKETQSETEKKTSGSAQPLATRST